MIPGLFVFILTAPEGILRARFDLEPGHCYLPCDVRVEYEAEVVRSAHTLRVEATALPSEDEFRDLAARAATRTADDTPNELRRLLNLLIPF